MEDKHDIRGMANQIARINVDLIMQRILSEEEFKRFEKLMKKVERSKIKSGDEIDKLNLTEDEKAEYAYFYMMLDHWTDKVFVPNLRDSYCYASNRESYTDLMSKFKDGDDESLFKLVKVFPNIKNQEPSVMRRYRRAELEQDLEFEKRYGEALNAKPIHKKVRRDLIFHLIFARDYVEKHTPKEILKYLKQTIGLKVKPDEKTIARYCQRLGIKTGEGKRGKRKSTGKNKPTTLKEVGVAFGISGERVRQIESKALRQEKWFTEDLQTRILDVAKEKGISFEEAKKVALKMLNELKNEAFDEIK